MAAKTFGVALGVDAKFLENTLTKDIAPLEAIFDLVDNAIDAARERILLASPLTVDRFGLPASYTGCQIRLKIGSKRIVISDNCTGIDRKVLARYAFVTGRVTEHKFGIGGFGIGLKRALFRLGRKYVLRTDTGTNASEMRFDKRHLAMTNAELRAEVVSSRKRVGTLILIDALELGVAHEFGATSTADWVAQLSRRYGLYVQKGLSLVVNGVRIPPFGPHIRKKGPVRRKAASVRTKFGVNVFIESGMHEKYRLKNEPDHTTNVQLTDQFGWYFVCNDRIVKIASREAALGWRTQWHQEYYGFVGWVRFVAVDPESLPWDTKKTSIDPNAPVFREIVDKLQTFAEAYKTENKSARFGRAPTSGKASTGKGKRQSTSEKSGGQAHNENWEELLPSMRIGADHPKIVALFREAQTLQVRDHPYAASLLFRSLLEFSLVVHLRESRKYSEVREMCFEEQSKAGRPFDDKQKRRFRPMFAQMIEWLNRNDDYFPSDSKRDCVASRNKLGGHMKELNGIVHEGDLTDSAKVKTMRNDSIALVRFLLRVD